MQKSSVNSNLNINSAAELPYTWQILKHKAHIEGTRAKVRFSSEHFPAYYQREVCDVQKSGRTGWNITTGLATFSGNMGVMPRSMYKKALYSLFDLGDSAALDFFSGFNFRYLSLYCSAELKHSLTAQMEEETFNWAAAEQSISHMLANLTGMVHDTDIVPKNHYIQYTGVIGLKLSCSNTLKNILSDYFESEFEIEHSSLEFSPLTPCSLTVLGQKANNNQLGLGALVGNCAPIVGQKIKIKICPKSYQEYRQIYNDPKLVPAIKH
ncbi:MAG: type VI secretion system baseplate subunit TssG, partial [Parashewanella sp.]